MKVIFLDNDGVICLAQQWGSRFNKQPRTVAETVADKNLSVLDRFDDFDKGAIKVLNEILEETGAEIVVSSDWQNFANCEELGVYYESQGIIKKPIDVTISGSGIDARLYKDFPWHRNEEREQTRSLEILEWLDRNLGVTHWVAVDDLHMGKEIKSSYAGPQTRDWGLTNFVWTPYSREGIKQSSVKEKILSYL